VTYRRFFSLFRTGGAAAEAEMDQEIETHVVMRAADLVRGGMDPDKARAVAEAHFGDYAATRRQLRAAARQRAAAGRQRDRLGALGADLRYAIRQVHRAPGFSLLAIGTLALGIGATTAMFTLVERVLLKPLPFREADRLVGLSLADSLGNDVPSVASSDWLDWQRAATIETTIHGFPYRDAIFAGDSARKAPAVQAPANFFHVVGIRFARGRAYSLDEAAQRAPVAVVSERLWRQLGGTSTATLRTPRATYDVVGVVAAGQEFPAGTDIWYPIAPRPGQPRVNVNYTAVGRLRNGVVLEQARAEMQGIARGIRAADPRAIYDFDVRLQPLREKMVAEISTYLELLMGVVGLVLIIVCANVAAAALARGATRSREMAIRTSLGAERARLVQQLLVEHVFLGLIAGGIGLFLAWAATKGFVARYGDRLPRASEVSLDWGVFAFAAGVSVFAGVIAGLIPALRITRVSLSSMMASGGRGSSRGHNTAGASLASLEIALAMLLLTGAGLLVQSFRAVLGRDIGFDTNVAVAEIALAGAEYRDSTARLAYWERLLDAYREIPGVDAVAVTQWVPLGRTGSGFIEVEGREQPGDGAVYRTVSRDFFKTLGMPLIAGRTFDEGDRSTSGRVTVINRAMAARYWPRANPIGKRVKARSMEGALKPADWLTIVGVVGDVRTYGLEEDARPEMYAYYEQTPSWTAGMNAVVRGKVPAAQLIPEMRRRAREIDARVPIDASTLEQKLGSTLSTRVLTMTLLTGFAGMALLLAALGIYGVLSYAVAQRRRELSVRAALGAQRSELLALVLVEGMRVVVIGMAFGLVGALWMTRYLETMLVDVSRFNAPVYVVAGGVLVVAALGAIIAPAWRAARSDPIVALQSE
jgi:predicted permease